MTPQELADALRDALAELTDQKADAAKVLLDSIQVYDA